MSLSSNRSRSALVASVLIAAAVLVLVAVHVTPRPYAVVPGSAPSSGGLPSLPSDSSSAPSSTPPIGRSLPDVSGFSWLNVLVVVVVGLVVVVAIGGMLLSVSAAIARLRGVRLALPRGRHTGRLAPAPPDLDDPGEVARVLDAGMVGLDAGDPDDAIIACWLRLADAARTAGVEGRRSDTAADFVARVTAAGLVRPEPLARLAALYREARFSEHAMTEADRAAARTALETARADLRESHHA